MNKEIRKNNYNRLRELGLSNDYANVLKDHSQKRISMYCEVVKKYTKDIERINNYILSMNEELAIIESKIHQQIEKIKLIEKGEIQHECHK